MAIETLLQRLCQGDRSAFAEIIERYQNPLFGYLGRMGLSQAEAEEIAQETFLRVWQNVGQYDPQRAAFSTWLFTIARHLAWRELERAASRPEPAEDSALEAYICEKPEPFDTLDRYQQVLGLRHALLQLTLEDRSALALAYFQGHDLAAIARIEDCSLAAIKVRIHRAKQKLRQLLERDDE